MPESKREEAEGLLDEVISQMFKSDPAKFIVEPRNRILSIVEDLERENGELTKRLENEIAWGDAHIKMATEKLVQLRAEIAALKTQDKFPAYPDTEADGVVFCGKCGTAI